MKHVLLSLLLLATSLSTSMAQRITGPGTNAVPGGGGSTTPPEYEAPITVFADSIGRVFQYLDRSASRIPSGILEECGMQFIDHAPFTGLAYTPDNQLDMNRWRALYGDMDGARINDNASVVPLATANLFLKPFANDGYVELPILHFDYHSIRTDALSSNRMQSVRNRLYDVAGQNPYQLNTVFAVAATDAALPTSSPSFVFRPSLFWTNTGRTVATLQADFADGSGFVPLTWNTPRAVSYSTGGAKDVRVRVTYTDGSTWVSHCQVIAPEPVAARYAGSGSNVTSFSLTADIPYQGAYGSALISVEYGGRNKATPDPAVLDKPLIVVKGFDVSGFFLGTIPRTDYKSFAASIASERNNGILSDGADLDGYDIVYVDFDNGTDYIQRNARLLEKVIKWVNQNKTGTQPNVILSMSMGGLVAQYALCEIESQNPTNPTAYPPHQVRLLITHDSPHQGANVPLSVQMTVRHLAGLSISNPIPFASSIKLVDRLPILGQARDALLSPAAQQMLRYQTARQTGPLGFGGKVVAASTSLYDTFQQEYQALLFADGRTGVPKGTTSLPCRVVASSNGSECGRGQPYEPYAVLLQIQQTQNIATIPLLAGGTAAAGAGLLLASGSVSGPAGIIAAGVFSAFALGLTGAYDVSAVAQLNALPDQQQREICYIWAKLKKRSRLFGLFDVSVSITDYRGNSLATQLPLDSGSGGIISLADYAQQLNGSALSIPPGVIRQQQFCFVPTYSALNIAPASSAALRASYTPGTNVGTPFANFRTAVRENESHISYTTINSTWMLQEIRQQTPSIPNCAAFCQANPVTIGGPQVCTGSSGLYSITPPANTTVAWQVQPFGIATLSSSSGSSTTVSPASSTANGRVTLTATIQSECGEFSVSKVIPVGRRPLLLSPAPYTITFCRNQEVYIQLIGLPFITGDYGTSGNSVVWSSDQPGGNGSVLVYGQGSGAVNYRTPPTGAPFVFTITVNDACGSYTSNPAFYYGAPANCAVRAAQPLVAATLYPNPAREAVEVHVENADVSQPLTVRVFDALGQPRAEQTKAGVETLTLNTEKLPAGLYFLHVMRGKEVLSRQQLRIEK